MSPIQRTRSDLPPSPAASTRRDALTYRHPRTLVEAFGPDARTACALEKPSHADLDGLRITRAACWLLALYAAVGAAYLVATA